MDITTVMPNKRIQTSHPRDACEQSDAKIVQSVTAPISKLNCTATERSTAEATRNKVRPIANLCQCGAVRGECP